MGVVRRLGALPPRAVLAIGWAIFLVHAFPGRMTRDSFDHLLEARAGEYTDSHPPVIDLLWKLCDYVIAGPFAMLVLQSVALLAGLYLVLARTFAPRRAAWLAVALFLFPPVVAPMAVIWKDCFMAGLLALGIAGLLSQRPGARWWGLAALLGATTMRYNAFGATLPLVVLLFEWRPGIRGIRRYALATAAWLAITLGAFAVNSALTDREMHYWHSSLAVYDIVGTLAHLDGDLPDAELRERLAGTELLVERDIHATARALYTTYHYYPIINDPVRRLWSLPISGYVPAPQAQRDAIARAWWATITAFPGAYARHRLAVTGAVLGFGDVRAGTAVMLRPASDVELAKELGLATASSKVQVATIKWLRRLEKAVPLFVPYVYAIAALLLLPIAVRQRDVLAILLSGLAMEGTLLVLAHSLDYRYSHWLVISTLLGAIVLVARRYRGARGEMG